MADFEQARRERERRVRRQRQRDLAIRLDQLASRAPAMAEPMLVQVIQQVAVPAGVPKYFACQVVDPGGAECEGCTPTFTVETGVVFVAVIGTKVPALNDYLIARPIGGRWVADDPKCTCVADGSHVCICACCTPWPKTMYTSDGLGTHAMAWNGAYWIGSASFSAPNPRWQDCRLCTDVGVSTIVPVSYQLTPTCGASPMLKLSVSFGIWNCTIGGVTSAYYSCTVAAPIPVSDTIPLPCDFSLMSFNIPTSISGLATPGGGGAMDVTP